MADNSTNLNIDNLDFDTIKASLKKYLQGQDQFKDYDFEGAGINVLMDVLAYNTHYQGYYANMVANETFLDSANLRASITSIAKHLNYLPKSYKSAVAYVDVEFLNLDANPTIKNAIINQTYFITTSDKFYTNTGSRIFLFSPTTNVLIKAEGSRYFARNVEIKEGETKTTTFVYDNNSNVDQKFAIPDVNVDIDTIAVRISNNIGDTTGSQDLWIRVADINKVSSASKVYFLQQNSDQQYELYFGDGVVGKLLQPGNVINVSYRVSSGSSANGLGKNETASNLTFKYSKYASTKVTLVTDSNGDPTPTFGGSELETLQSIKYYAPRNYQAQGRAVTAEDYRTLLANQYGEQAESVFIWGGEDNDPPVYGKVFVSIKPKNAEKLTQLQKIAIAKNILKEKNVVSITPEIVDPDYLYLLPTLSIKYDASKTTATSDTLASSIKSVLLAYVTSEIGKFDRDFVESSFLSTVVSAFNPPVVSANMSLQMQKRLEPNLEAITTYVVNFDNEIYHPIDGYTPVLTSTVFGYQDSTSSETVKPNVDAYINDDGSGNIRIYKLVGGTKIYLNETAGTIDYTTGKISLLNFAPQYLDSTDTYIQFTTIPNSKDISSRRNQILIVEDSGLDVNCTPQTFRYDPYSSSGSSFVGNN